MSYLRCGADRWRSEAAAAAAAEDDDGGEKCLELSGQNTRACVHLHVTSARGSSLAKLSSRAHSHVVTMQTPREEADVPPCFYFETHLYLLLRGGNGHHFLSLKQFCLIKKLFKATFDLFISYMYVCM